MQGRINKHLKIMPPITKILLTILFIAPFQQLLFGQLTFGTYVLQTDTAVYMKDTNNYKSKIVTEFVSYPNLEIRNDHTFIYNWNQPNHCIMGSTLGTWSVEKGTLLLKDSIYKASGVGGSRPDRIATSKHETVFKIDNLKFIYFYTKYDNDTIDSNSYMGDFRFYKE